MVEWPFEDSVTVPTGWKYFAGLGQGVQKAVYAICYEPVTDIMCYFSDSQDSTVHK